MVKHPKIIIDSSEADSTYDEALTKTVELVLEKDLEKKYAKSNVGHNSRLFGTTTLAAKKSSLKE